MESHMPPDAQDDLRDRPTAELVKQLSEQTRDLVRQEIELAKLELSNKAKRFGIGGGMFGGAGLLALYAVGALTACLVLAMSLTVAGWLAALIVAVVYAAIAGALALVGKRQVKAATPPVPEQTVDSVKEDVRWTKQRAKVARQ